MHNVEIPSEVTAQVVAKRGVRHVFTDIQPAQTALLVVDMQNAFLLPQVAHALVPGAPEIVSTVNRLASALRDAGALVVWIKATADQQTLRSWSCYHGSLLSPAESQRRLAAVAEGTKGNELWPALDIRPEDEVVSKTRYSAFIQGASNLEEVLRRRSVDTVIVSGAATNVCCDSTARDAMMLNFRTIMVSDANAAAGDEVHLAALVNFYLYFGDVMTTEEVIGYLRAAGTTTGSP